MSIRALLGIISIAALISCAPNVPFSVLELPAGESNFRNSEGDFILLKGGDILFAYSKFVGNSGDDRILLAYCAEDHLRHLRITSVPLCWLPED